MTKLVDMIVIAQTVPYVEPISQNIDEWTSDELLFKSINIALENGIQIRAALNICNTFPPLKIIYKSILSKYITHYNSIRPNPIYPS